MQLFRNNWAIIMMASLMLFSGVRLQSNSMYSNSLNARKDMSVRDEIAFYAYQILALVSKDDQRNKRNSELVNALLGLPTNLDRAGRRKRR
ncbi:unnamed protein product [Gordionus sp. m RMFG-2023]